MQKRYIGIFASIAGTSACVAAAYFMAEQAHKPADPVGEALETVKQNYSKPCGSEKLKQSPVLIANRKLECH